MRTVFAKRVGLGDEQVAAMDTEHDVRALGDHRDDLVFGRHVDAVQGELALLAGILRELERHRELVLLHVVVERLHTTRGAQADLGQFLATLG